LWVYGFRFYFTPLAGVLFAFPSRYFCAIGRIQYLALDRGRPGFRQGFSCPAVLRIPLPYSHHFKYGAFTLSGRLSQNLSPIMTIKLLQSFNPALTSGLGSSDFARRYFRNLVHLAMLLISLPGVLRWFSSPSFASVNYLFIHGYQALARWVTPFGYQRISGCLLLPVASRSLPRPSSPRYA
jgi:hypothetical protein